MPLNIINYSNFVDKNGQITAINRVQGTLKYGSTWHEDMQAQEKVLQRLGKTLHDRYTVIRSLMLPELDIPIPLVLIGPMGIQILYATNISGFYKADGDDWQTMKRRSKEFTSTTPNPISRTLLYSKVLEQYLHDNDQQIELLGPVLLFANPGIHVETNNPAVRIVLVDAFRRYASSIPEMPPVLPPSAVKTIVTLLGEANSKARTPVKEEVSQQRANPLLAMIDQLKFSRKQWIVLIALFAFLVLLLMGFVLYVLLF